MDKDTGRVEAFSDGVFAIAITLLILEIRVPELAAPASSGQLFGALLRLWPWLVILVMWINHHEFMRWVPTSDYRALQNIESFHGQTRAVGLSLRRQRGCSRAWGLSCRIPAP
jgi:uncharacterized membrane protein